jgi:hypothetical protein
LRSFTGRLTKIWRVIVSPFEAISLVEDESENIDDWVQ